MGSAHAFFYERDINEPHVVQRVLKGIDSSDGTEYLFKESEVERIMEGVYYAELEDIASEDEVRDKIKELILSDEENSFYDFGELKDFLCGYFTEESPDEPLPDLPAEGESSVYTGVLSAHPLYHDVIKPKIIETITKKKLQRCIKNKRQTNFDFYTKNGGQIYVSGNQSKKAEKRTGFKIIFHTERSFSIVPVDMSDSAVLNSGRSAMQ